MPNNTITIPNYVPEFLLKFWLSTGPILPPRPPRVHVYDVYDNELMEFHRPPKDPRPIFQDLKIDCLEGATHTTLLDAERAFSVLETDTRVALNDFLERTVWNEEGYPGTKALPYDRLTVETLRKYFVFLRFRNSEGYHETVCSLEQSYQTQPQDGNLYPAFRPLIVQHRLRFILRTFILFFRHNSSDGTSTNCCPEQTVPESTSMDPFQDMMNFYCWRMCNAELCIGIATEDQEFILSDRCFGSLGEEGFKEDRECYDIFFPIFPTLALYILGTTNSHLSAISTYRQTSHSTVWLDLGLESASDVHLRNAMVLQTYPSRLYFSSLRTVALSISSYDEFRWIQEHQDYSRLKQRCRQKFLQETVTKTLVIRGSLILTDLTDEVIIIGDSAVAHGSFSDVWKGTWNDPIERRPRTVALKFLRQIMVQNIREKLLKRLQTEVLAWHRLCHRNVSQLFGIVQSPHSIAMVSQWCDNGTICHYLKHNPEADRLKLIASGIAYLHTAKPMIVHGDLKGGNILIDEKGHAIITDFGLSKVMEEMSEAINMSTSFFAGSTRWMAPELIMSLINDDGCAPPITTFSDIYAFASVCFEIATGQLPYPNRSNDHAVTVDIIRGIKPSRYSTCLLKLRAEGENSFWHMLDQCWSDEPNLRPTMSRILSSLETLDGLRQ